MKGTVVASDNRMKKVEKRRDRENYERPNRGFVIDQQMRENKERARKLRQKRKKRT
jgi:hypothetical protein